jgi:hypothetical protein
MRIFTVKKLTYLLVLVVSACPYLHAQTGVYGAFSASNYNLPNIGWQYGPTFGLYADPFGVPFVKAGVDLRETLAGTGSTQRVDSYLGGARVQLHPHVVPVMPYAEALAGVAHVNVGQGFALTNGNGFEYQILGGVDVTVAPHLDWRAVEYSWGQIRVSGENFNPQTVSTGIVVRLP